MRIVENWRALDDCDARLGVVWEPAALVEEASIT
jgi:hypothetical protein